MSMAIRRDAGEDTAITHLFEFMFLSSQGTPLDSISAVKSVIMKQEDGSSSRTLAGLSRTERDTLHGLLGKVLANVVQAKEGGAWICRLCDLDACGRAAGHCPAANAGLAKYGPPSVSD